MPTFKRSDICEAHLAVEQGWHSGGWLHERPSNQRHMRSTDVQLHRMKFAPRAGNEFKGYESLTYNGKQIYWTLVKRYGFETDATSKLLAELDAFTDAYVVAAIWSSTDDKDVPLDRNYEACDLAPETLKQMVIDCKLFQNTVDHMLSLAGTPEQNGHDFWLTRNHHGVGFWDRGYRQDIGDGLTKAAHSYGECSLFVNDDGKIYFM